IGGRRYFKTKGDANDTADADLASADALVGRVRFDLPHAGRWLIHLRHPSVRLGTLGCFSAWLIGKNGIALRRAVRNARADATKRTPASGTTVPALVIVAGALLVQAV